MDDAITLDQLFLWSVNALKVSPHATGETTDIYLRESWQKNS